MTIDGYETIILAGIMLLTVWYISLPYDNVLFDAWNITTNQGSRGNHDPQNPLPMTRTIVEQVDKLYNIGYITEGIVKIITYFAIPSTILFKMFITVKRELQFNLP